MTTTPDDVTPRPCRFCVHYLREAPELGAAICSHLDRARLHWQPDTGCADWVLEERMSAAWYAWVDDDYARRLTTRLERLARGGG